MSWSQWPQTTGALQGWSSNTVAPTGAPVTPLTTPGTPYTPEQWAAMQQQNWQQWMQWQQQYQQWQQQYGEQYQKSMALAGQPSTLPVMPVQPPLPIDTKVAPPSVPPPLPDSKPPLPPEEPPKNSASMIPCNTSVPPPAIAPPPPPPPPQQQQQQNSFSEGSYNQGMHQQQSGINSHGPNRFGIRPPASNSNFNVPRPSYNQNYRSDKLELGKRPGEFNDNFDEAKKNRLDSTPSGNSLDQNKPWNSNSRNQQQWQGNQKSAPKINVEELSEAEKNFDKQFEQWEAQFNKWKEQNANHPDKQQYKEYEAKWESWRTQLLDRREQMRKKRLGLISGPSSNKPTIPPTDNFSSSINQDDENVSNSETPPSQSTTGQDTNKDKNFLTMPNISSNNIKEFTNKDQSDEKIENVEDIVNAENNLSFLFNQPPKEQRQNSRQRSQSSNSSIDTSYLTSTSNNEGIPGLDLVKDDDGKLSDYDVVEKKMENPVPGPDFEAISKGINSILGDEKILSMLSMVTQNKKPDILNQSEQQSLSSNETNADQNARNDSFDRNNSFDDSQQNQRPNTRMDSNRMPPFHDFSQPPPNNRGLNNFNQGPPNRESNDFNQGPANRGSNDFNQGPPNRGPNDFNQGPPNRGPNDFNQGPPNREPNNFNQGPPNRGLNNFNQGPLNRGPNNFTQGPPNRELNDFDQGSLNRGPNNFNQGPQIRGLNDFHQGPINKEENNFSECPPNRGPNDFHQGLLNRGPNDFNQGPPNRGLNNFNQGSLNRGPHNFNQDLSNKEQNDFNQEPLNRGPNNFNQAPPDRKLNDFNLSSKNRGPNDFNDGLLNRGFRDFNQGPPNRGLNDFNNQDSVNRGPNNFSRGLPNRSFNDSENRGPDDFNQDLPNRNFNQNRSNEFNQDSPNRKSNDFNQGPNNFNRGLSNNFNQGPPSRELFNSGPLNRGPNDFNQGPLNKGPNNFNQGPLNRGLNDFNQGRPNRGLNDFNQGPSNRGSNDFNQGLSNRGPNDFSQVPPNRGPNDFNQGPPNRESNDFNQGPPNRGSNNFNQGPPNRGPNDFNQGLLNRRSGDFNQGPPDRDQYQNYNNGPTNFNRAQHNFNQGMINRGSFNQDLSNVNQGPRNNFSQKNQFNLQSANRNVWESNDFDSPNRECNESMTQLPDLENQESKDFDQISTHSSVERSLGSKKEFDVNDSLDQNSKNSNDFNRNRSDMDSFYDQRFNSKNDSYNKNYDKYWDEALILKPVTVVDYGHKSLNKREENFLEPVQTFDYGHTSKNLGKNKEKFESVDNESRVNKFNKFEKYDEVKKHKNVLPLIPHLQQQQQSTDSFKRNKSFEDDRKQIDNRGSFNDRNDGNRYYHDKLNNFNVNRSPSSEREIKNEQFLNKPNPIIDFKKDEKKTVTMIEDLLVSPGRNLRPPRIVIILRGPPGSGKTFLAKLIKDKEVEQGGSAPRILSLDDYFMVEQDKEIIEKDTGRKTIVKEMVYEYEECMETVYRQSLDKAFKKTITDGFFPFIILDCVNDKIKYFSEMWSFAKQNGFQVYICQMELDVAACTKRNVHHRSEIEIERLVAGWESNPPHYLTLDATSLIQDGCISEVEMEEVSEYDNIEEEDSSEDHVIISKWERMEHSDDKLARLDGTSKPLRHRATMEDYLQLDDDIPEDRPGEKRVRWADLEEKRQQEKMRAIGFVVGQTDWGRMMDPTQGGSALTQTKYIERVRRF